MDTVELNGNGFEILVKQGDLVKAGDLLIRFDIEAIRAAGYSVITPQLSLRIPMHLPIYFELDQKRLLQNEDVLAIVKIRRKSGCNHAFQKKFYGVAQPLPIN